MRYGNAFLLTLGIFLSLAAAAADPVRFEPNRGQADPRWSFVARTADGLVLLGEREIRLGDAVLTLPGSDGEGSWEAVVSLPGRAHYLLGADPERFILDVPTSAGVARRSVGRGIDVAVHVTGRRVVLAFTAAPDADATSIALDVDDPSGSLRASAPLSGGKMRVALPLEVSIEQVDATAEPEPVRLARDAEGNLFIAGRTDGPAGVFVTMLDPSGRDVVRTTYLDGLDPLAPLSLAVAPSGEIALAGAADGHAVVVRLDPTGRKILHRTSIAGTDAAAAVAVSPDGAVWITGPAAADAFVARLDLDGAAALVATLPACVTRALAHDGDGSVYVTGATRSGAFVTKLDPLSGRVVYSTALGGAAEDEGTAIAVSAAGEAVVVGTGSDAFFARLSASGKTSYSTHLGSASEVRPTAVALDRSGRAWVAGSRGPDAYVRLVAQESGDATREHLFAGNSVEAASGLVVDGNGDLVVAGLTRSAMLPETERPESTRGADVFVARVEGGLAPQGVCPGSKNFTGLDGNTWEDPDNWSGHILPSASDDVCIQGFNVVVVGGGSVGTLRVEGGSLTINSGTITVAGASEFTGSLTIAGGTLTGAGNRTTSGSFSFTAGTLSGSGITTSNGPVSIGGTLSKGLFAHRWDINGNVTWTGTGSFGLSSGAIVNTTATWDCQSDAVLSWPVGTATAVNNSGTFKKSAGAGTTAIQAPFYNTGSVLIQTGLMNLTAGGSSTGSFDVPAGRTLQLGGGTYSFDAGTTFTGAGNVLLSAATLNVNAAVTVTIPASMTFDMAGGTLANTGTLTVNGPLNWTAGTMQHGGVTTCNGALNISGTVAKGIQLGRTLNNNATCNYTASGSGNLGVSSATVINNTGTWDFQGDGSVVWGVGTAPPFNNSGTLKKSSGASVSTVSVPFYNTGAVLVQTGTLNSTGGGSSSGSFDVAAGKTLQFGGGTYGFDAGTTFSGGGNVLLSAATLNVNAAVTVPASMTFDMTGGILASTGTLTLNGPLNWSAGTMQHGGVTTCNGTLNISGTGAKGIQLGRTLNNNATCNYTASGSGNLGVSTATVINNPGTWDLQGDGSIIWGVGTAPAFNNSGTFKKSSGAGVSTLSLPFYNTGGVLVQTGTLSSTGSGSSTGSWDIALGTTLLYNGNSFDLNAGNVFTGLGTITLGACTWNVNAANTIPAPIVFNMSSTSATVNGVGTLTTFGLFNWTAGSMGSAGVTTVEGPMTISTTASKGIGSRTLNTNATTTWSGAGTNIGMSFGAVINNNGTWEVLNDASMAWGVGAAPSFRNFGTFRKSVGVGATSFTLPVQNQGTVDIQSGTISNTSYTQTAGTTRLNGGNFSDTTTIAIQGGTLAGSGTVTGPVTVSGTGALSPGLSAGALAITGNYVQQAPTGAFTVEIGGLAPGTQYDRATVSGTATLAGVLNVSLINGFVPLPGDTFTVMTYASRTGTYTLNLPSVGCIGWRVSYGATALTLTAAAVPEEIAALTMTSKTAFSWADSPIYANTSYNVLRGDLDKLPVGPGADETCVIPTTTATSGTDATTPVAGRGFWYLVREKVTSCGTGTYGFRTGGIERISTSCP